MQSIVVLLLMWACVSGTAEGKRKRVDKTPNNAVGLLREARAADQAGEPASALGLYEQSIRMAKVAGADRNTLAPMYHAAIVAARATSAGERRRPLLYAFIDLLEASPSKALLQAMSELADLEESAGRLLEAHAVLERAALVSPTTHQLRNGVSPAVGHFPL